MKLNVCLGAALMLWQGAAFAQSTYGTIYGTITDPSSGVIRDAVVPIVPGAIVFDLLNGGDKSWGRFPPYRDLGYEAAATAGPDFATGSVGAEMPSARSVNNRRKFNLTLMHSRTTTTSLPRAT